jgi:hypothetical protein
MYKLNSDNSTCNEIVPNCKVLDSNNEKCEECKDNFYFLDDDKYHCYNDSLDNDKFFTEDDGKTYINCSKVIQKCDKCKDRIECLKCDDGYIFNKINLTCIFEITSCKIYDINNTYCEECDEGYYLLNDDKNHCYNDSLDKDKYFTEDEGKTYISCDKAINNCEKCDNKKKCNKCQEYFELVNDGEKCIHFDVNNECNITTYYIEDENIIILTEDYIENLIKKYENENKYNFGKVEYYTNNNNLTITIFTLDNCTKNLLQMGAYSLNT